MVEKIFNTITEYAVSAGVRLLFAIAVLIIGWKLIGFLVKSFSKGKGFLKISGSAQTFIKSAVSVTLKIVLIMTVSGILGVPTTSMIALVGSAGLAIGLALQGSLSNFAGGLMILIFKPFEVGDYITSGDVSGKVYEINIFYTKLMSPDNKKQVIPNGILSNQSVTNFSKFPTRRIELDVFVNYNNDIDKVKELLKNVACNDDRILKDPEVSVVLLKQIENSLNFQLRAWCKNEDYWDLYFALNEKIKKTFDENNIYIPRPQLEVHIDK